MIASRLKEKKRWSTSIPFNQTDPVPDYAWWLFWSLQIADVLTTKEGLKYDCVYESNPILPKVPHLDRLIIHKAVFLHPFIVFQKEDILSKEDMLFPNLFGLFVIHNNLKIIESAKQRCNLR